MKIIISALFSASILMSCSSHDNQTATTKKQTTQSGNINQMTNNINIVTYTSLNVVTKNKKEFEKQIATLATAIRNKKGCLKCQWFSNPEDENNYFMYIEFDNEENFTAYRESKDVLEIIHTKTAPLLKTRPSFKYFRGQVFKEG